MPEAVRSTAREQVAERRLVEQAASNDYYMKDKRKNGGAKMEKYIWLFPVLFIIHDFEEIIGFGIWGKKNIPVIQKRFPKVGRLFEKMYSLYSTEGMALAVLESLLLCVIICLLAVTCGLYQLWLGAFIAFIIHMFIHIIQSVLWRGYIPALITSILLIPISIFIARGSFQELQYSTLTVIVWSLIGLILIMVNLQFAHFLMHWFTKKFNLQNNSQ